MSYTPIIVSAEASGACEDSLTWTLNSNGVLTIRGTGGMSNWLSGYEVLWRRFTVAVI